MTKEELESAQATIKRANELLANIATCEGFANQRLTLRKPGGDYVGDLISDEITRRGLKAWRDDCEKELAALKLGPTPPVPPLVDPFRWPLTSPFPYPPLAPTCGDGFRTIQSSDTATIGDVLK